MTAAALSLLRTTAPDYGAVVLQDEADQLLVTMTIHRAGGQTEEFHLAIRVQGAQPRVSEVEPRRLPTFCLERHINHDGSFCLSWSPGTSEMIKDAVSAAGFWSDLDRFLHRQITAETIHRWPDAKNARAHGDAAKFQAHAEALAGKLGSSFLADLQRGKLTIRVDRKRHRKRLELWRGDRRIARTQADGGPLVTSQTRCPCDQSAGASVPVCACGDHSQVLADLIKAMEQWKTIHEKFVRGIFDDGRRCCGSMEFCELRDLQMKALRPRSTKSA